MTGVQLEDVSSLRDVDDVFSKNGSKTIDICVRIVTEQKGPD